MKVSHLSATSNMYLWVAVVLAILLAAACVLIANSFDYGLVRYGREKQHMSRDRIKQYWRTVELGRDKLLMSSRNVWVLALARNMEHSMQDFQQWCNELAWCAPDRVHVRMFENGSSDNTPQLLQEWSDSIKFQRMSAAVASVDGHATSASKSDSTASDGADERTLRSKLKSVEVVNGCALGNCRRDKLQVAVQTSADMRTRERLHRMAAFRNHLRNAWLKHHELLHRADVLSGANDLSETKQNPVLECDADGCNVPVCEDERGDRRDCYEPTDLDYQSAQHSDDIVIVVDPDINIWPSITGLLYLIGREQDWDVVCVSSTIQRPVIGEALYDSIAFAPRRPNVFMRGSCPFKITDTGIPQHSGLTVWMDLLISIYHENGGVALPISVYKKMHQRMRNFPTPMHPDDLPVGRTKIVELARLEAQNLREYMKSDGSESTSLWDDLTKVEQLQRLEMRDWIYQRMLHGLFAYLGNLPPPTFMTPEFRYSHRLNAPDELQPVSSAFGGMAMYHARVYGDKTVSYAGFTCEHVALHAKMLLSGLDRIYISPAWYRKIDKH